jgi:ABC-type branched-subunit amino acid transport system ATPase component
MNALALADRAYVIDRGRVTKAGLSTSLAGDPVIREAYMRIAGFACPTAASPCSR